MFGRPQALRRLALPARKVTCGPKATQRADPALSGHRHRRGLEHIDPNTSAPRPEQDHRPINLASFSPGHRPPRGTTSQKAVQQVKKDATAAVRLSLTAALAGNTEHPLLLPMSQSPGSLYGNKRDIKCMQFVLPTM